MEDILIYSRFSKEETVRKLKQMFAGGNPFDIEMEVLYGEYYLSPTAHQFMPKTASINPFAIQFRLKEDAATGKTILELTPQSRAFSITIGVLILFLLWIFILVATLENKGWLQPVFYFGGTAITLIVFLFLKLGNNKETEILKIIKKEFEEKQKTSTTS
ncbi:hypothetical protein [Pontibacter populi]|uniref:GTP-binding protein n=1 Tax=Pontibacter populi TaxID=890055 RepID=A0ABV1RTC0_9BACT